jgi:hypothetical protein
MTFSNTEHIKEHLTDTWRESNPGQLPSFLFSLFLVQHPWVTVSLFLPSNLDNQKYTYKGNLICGFPWSCVPKSLRPGTRAQNPLLSHRDCWATAISSDYLCGGQPGAWASPQACTQSESEWVALRTCRDMVAISATCRVPLQTGSPLATMYASPMVSTWK